MRILMVNQYATPPDRPGGSRHHVFARELGKLGHDVLILASDVTHMTKKSADQRRGWRGRSERVDGVDYYWVPTPPYSGNGPMRAINMAAFSSRVLASGALRELGRPDVVLGSSPHIFGAGSAELLATALRVPFVLEIRDLWPQSLVELGHIRQSHPVVRALEVVERRLYKRASAIVTLLPAAGNHVELKGGDPSKVHWIPNGVDFDFVGAPTHQQPSGRAMTWMYAGSHALANDLDVFLDSAKLLQDRNFEGASFRLVGDGAEKERLVQRANELGLRNVVFEDAVPKEKIYEKLNEADAFFVFLRDSPLYKWGISLNKLHDYLAVGRPIVFAGQAANNPVAEARAGLAIPPGDAHAFADAIEQVSAMPRDERAAMGVRGHDYALAQHDLRTLAKRLEAILQSVV